MSDLTTALQELVGIGVQFSSEFPAVGGVIGALFVGAVVKTVRSLRVDPAYIYPISKWLSRKGGAIAVILGWPVAVLDTGVSCVSWVLGVRRRETDMSTGAAEAIDYTRTVAMNIRRQMETYADTIYQQMRMNKEVVKEVQRRMDQLAASNATIRSKLNNLRGQVDDHEKSLGNISTDVEHLSDVVQRGSDTQRMDGDYYLNIETD